MYIFLKTVAKTVRTEKGSALAAAFLIFTACVLRMSLDYVPLLLLVIVGWLLICLIPHLPQLEAERRLAEQAITEKNELVLLNDQISHENNVLKTRLMAHITPTVSALLRAHGFKEATWHFQSPNAENDLVANKKVRIFLSGCELCQYADLQYISSGNLLIEIIQPILNKDTCEVPSKGKRVEPDLDILPDSEEPPEPYGDSDISYGEPSKEMHREEKPANSDQDAVLRRWINSNGMQVRELCFDAFEKQLDSLVMKNDLPDKNLWSRLAAIMEDGGQYAAVEAVPEGIKIHLKRENSLLA